MRKISSLSIITVFLCVFVSFLIILSGSHLSWAVGIVIMLWVFCGYGALVYTFYIMYASVGRRKSEEELITFACFATLVLGLIMFLTYKVLSP